LVAAFAAGLVAIPAAQSTQGQPVIAGQHNDSTADTVLQNLTPDAISLRAVSGGGTGAIAVFAAGSAGIGVKATNQSAGTPALQAENFSANGGVAIEALNHAPNWVAIWGHHDPASFGYGVLGEAPIGVGVLGRGSDSGVKGSTDSAAGSGVRAENTAGGNALTVSGKASFSRSGVVTIPAGAISFTQTGVPLSASSFVLATMQTKAAPFVKAAVPDPAANSFTIYLNRTAPVGGVRVAYLIGD
jgi:hypothetical protein